MGDGSYAEWRERPKSGMRPPAGPTPAPAAEEEELEQIETTEVVVEVGAPRGALRGTAALRRPLSAYFSFCGKYMDLGVVGAGGYFVAGGNDTSPFSRENLARRCRVEPTASREVGAAEPVDVVFAAPPSRGLEAGAAIGAALHASSLASRTTDRWLAGIQVSLHWPVRSYGKLAIWRRSR